MALLEEWGLVDVFRRLRPEPGIYSWWDYRRATSTRGARLRFARKGKLASDHAPLLVDFDLSTG